MRMPWPTKAASAPRKPVQKPHSPLIIRKFLLFPPKLRPVRLPAAARKFHRMLYVQHLVIHHISHHKFWHHVAVQLPVDHNLLQRRIETTEHAAPNSPAPTQPRLGKPPKKNPALKPPKNLAQDWVVPPRPGAPPAAPAAAAKPAIGAASP